MIPAWLPIAEAQIGVAETPGAKSTPKILQWARAVGRWLGINYSDDATPWCGLFAAYCLETAGIDPPKMAARAKSWANWGKPLPYAACGAVLVFERPGGGHVGFCVGETATAYRVLGGNQGDRVSYVWIAKDRCIAIRWPAALPAGARLTETIQTGALSRNEA